MGGLRSVSRGRSYMSQGRVHDLAISRDGWLLATVTGGDRYAATVWCDPERKKGGRSSRAVPAQLEPAVANMLRRWSQSI